jgi:hypothetical protein
MYMFFSLDIRTIVRSKALYQVSAPAQDKFKCCLKTMQCPGEISEVSITEYFL